VVLVVKERGDDLLLDRFFVVTSLDWTQKLRHEVLAPNPRDLWPAGRGGLLLCHPAALQYCPAFEDRTPIAPPCRPPFVNQSQAGLRGLSNALKSPRTAHDRAGLQPHPGASCSADEPNTRTGKIPDQGANSVDILA
jgi:hypothetical protein